VSLRRAHPAGEPDVSPARRKVSCFWGLLLAAAGISDSVRGGVSTSSRFQHAERHARCLPRAASLPHVRAFLFAKLVSALCKTRMAALRPGTCIYIIRHTSIVNTTTGYPLLRDLCVLCGLSVKAFLSPDPTRQKTKTLRFLGALFLPAIPISIF